MVGLPCLLQIPIPQLGVLTSTAIAQEVATFTATCEKYVGTESGGMDQAISIMGQQGIAKLVMFNPVRSLTLCVNPLVQLRPTSTPPMLPEQPCAPYSVKSLPGFA